MGDLGSPTLGLGSQDSFVELQGSTKPLHSPRSWMAFHCPMSLPPSPLQEDDTIIGTFEGVTHYFKLLHYIVEALDLSRPRML